MASLLHELLTESAGRVPDHPCLVHGTRTLTYADVHRQVRELAALLVRHGVRAGDRVAVHLEKSIEETVAILAASMAGAVVVNVNAQLKARQVSHILDDSGAATLVTSYSRVKMLGAVLPQARHLRTLVVSGHRTSLDHLGLPLDVVDAGAAAGEADAAIDVRRIDRDIAAILYTSGSTGLPKGVVFSHRNLLAGADSVSRYLASSGDDRILSILPFSFDYGLNQLTTTLLAGGTLVLKTHLNAADTLRTLEAERITGLAGIPTLWSQLLQADWGEMRFEHLRYITNSGGRFPEELVKEYRRRVPHTRVFLMYGLTEAFRSTYLDPDQVDVRPGSIGKAIPNAEIMVVNDRGELCAPGEVGELVHRGAHVTLGYWNEPELTRQRFRRNPLQPAGLPFDDLVVFSGDLVRCDDEGYLYYVGRKDHMIKTSGFRVSPTEVEEYFYNTGLVRDAVAFGLPDAVLGEKIHVVLSVRDGVTSTGAELLAAVAKAMPTYMVPRSVQLVDALPKTSSGKIDRTLVCAAAS